MSEQEPPCDDDSVVIEECCDVLSSLPGPESKPYANPDTPQRSPGHNILKKIYIPTTSSNHHPEEPIKAHHPVIRPIFAINRFVRQFVVALRTKKRRNRLICSIVHLVRKWVRIQVSGCTPKEAAQMLKINVKTLYDYIEKMEKCWDYGYDFEKNRDKKVGAMTSFIQAHESGSERQTEDTVVRGAVATMPE